LVYRHRRKSLSTALTIIGSTRSDRTAVSLGICQRHLYWRAAPPSEWHWNNVCIRCIRVAHYIVIHFTHVGYINAYSCTLLGCTDVSTTKRSVITSNCYHETFWWYLRTICETVRPPLITSWNAVSISYRHTDWNCQWDNYRGQGTERYLEWYLRYSRWHVITSQVTLSLWPGETFVTRKWNIHT